MEALGLGARKESWSRRASCKAEPERMEDPSDPGAEIYPEAEGNSQPVRKTEGLQHCSA